MTQTTIVVRDNKIEIVEIAIQGPAGPRGLRGLPGLPGTGTATVYRSTDAPGDDTGQDGDFWFVLKT